MLKLLTALVLLSLCSGAWGQHVGDFDGNSQVGYPDFLAWIQAFQVDDMRADLNADGVVNFMDFVFFASIYDRPVFRRTDNGIWLSTPRGYHYQIDEQGDKHKIISADSLSIYVGCPPEYGGEHTLIWDRHEGNAGTPREWYVGIQFFVLTIWANSVDDAHYVSLIDRLKERYDFENKFLWARRDGDFFVANRSVHRDDLKSWPRPVCEAVANADGSVTVTCDGEEETPRTPEWVPQFIEMLQDPLVKGIQMPFSTPLYPQYLVHSPDTIYDSASYTHWDITAVIKDELRRVQRQCERQSGADVF